MLPGTKSLHLKGLNGIRAIAALSVVISHTLLGLEYFGLKKIVGGWGFATYGVTMFFTLSGFLITFLLVKEKEKFNTINIKDFYLRRILRIWPLYYLYFLVAILVLNIYIPTALPGSILYYIFLAANLPMAFDIMLPLLTHYWSLGVEEQFYLIWPWLFKKYSPIKSITAFIGVFIIIKLFLRILIPHSAAYSVIYVTKFDCMAIGAFFSILYNHNHKKFLSFCFNIIVQVISWSIWLLAALDWLKIFDFINHDVFSLATAIIILNVAFNSSSLIKLDNRLFNFLGKISYGIYVYHVLLIFILGKLLIGYLPTENYYVQISIILIIVLISTITIAFVSYNFFEKPFLLLKGKFTKVPSHS